MAAAQHTECSGPGCFNAAGLRVLHAELSCCCADATLFPAYPHAAFALLVSVNFLFLCARLPFVETTSAHSLRTALSLRILIHRLNPSLFCIRDLQSSDLLMLHWRLQDTALPSSCGDRTPRGV